jgi:hypothetical protein
MGFTNERPFDLHARVRRHLSSFTFVAAVVLSPLALAQAGAALSASPPWNSLTPAQQTALRPLENEWAGIDTQRRQKWIEVASRFDRMSPDERQRTQERMGEWARMSPKQRNEARANFQTARQQLTTDERQQRWEAYRALPEQERNELAAQSKAKPVGAVERPRALVPISGPKVNTVPNPLFDVRKPKPVVPGINQAKPGATTTPIAVKPSPPLHQQTGLPKVAATPEFVDTTTLLPQRGAQGAAVEPRPKR